MLAGSDSLLVPLYQMNAPKALTSRSLALWNSNSHVKQIDNSQKQKVPQDSAKYLSFTIGHSNLVELPVWTEMLLALVSTSVLFIIGFHKIPQYKLILAWPFLSKKVTSKFVRKVVFHLLGPVFLSNTQALQLARCCFFNGLTCRASPLTA